MNMNRININIKTFYQSRVSRSKFEDCVSLPFLWNMNLKAHLKALQMRKSIEIFISDSNYKVKVVFDIRIFSIV